MSRDELLQTLRRRLVDAAVDHNSLRAVLLVGKQEAFPESLWDDSEARDAISWPKVRGRSASPIATSVASFYRKQPHANERIEVIAFFGGQSELALFSTLAGSATNLVSGFDVPEGYEAHDQHFAWARWLFDQSAAVDLQYHRITWKEHLAGTTHREKLASPFDPLTKRPPPRAKYLEWSVCSWSSTNVFRLSLCVADALVPVADSKTDKKTKFSAQIPENSKVTRLAKKIKKERAVVPRMIDIARDFTNGDEQQAQNLMRQIRRFRHLLE